MNVKEDLIETGTQRSERRSQDNTKASGGNKTYDGLVVKENSLIDGDDCAISKHMDDSKDSDNTTDMLVKDNVALMRPASPVDQETSLGAE